MAADERWYFTKEQIQNTPSRKCGFDADKELSYRQQAANFIQDMGQKLQVTQLCINTAIVYMHRFYMFHSFTHFPWNTIAAASFFLAAKVEEQPRKLEHVIRATNVCLHRDPAATFDVKSEQYASQSQDLVFNENVLLQTLGFDVAIDHPHTHVVRCCHLVKASKDLAQTSYFMASNSLHLTTMCLQYKPTVVACFCIHLACKWSNWQIPKSNEGRDWFYYVDRTVTSELLEQLTAEFLVIFDKCPSRLKRKILSISSNNTHGPTEQHSTNYSPSDFEPRKINPDKSDRVNYDAKLGFMAEDHKKRVPDATQRVDYREYKEKKERERYEREKQQLHAKQGVQPSKPPIGAPVNKPPHNHHRPPMGPNDPKIKMHHRPASNREVPDSSSHRDPNQAQIPREYNREINGRESTREMLHREHNNREVHNRDILVNKDVQKPHRPDNIKLESEKVIDSEKRFDNNRQKLVDPKLLSKHDPNRLNYQKRPETVPNSDKKLVLQQNVSQDKNSYLINKHSNNSTSQKHKSPFEQKSVPIPQNYQKTNNNSSENNKNGNSEKTWLDNVEEPSLVQTPPVKTRQPSLFSPEKTSPPKKIPATPPNIEKKIETQQINLTPQAISPFTSPPPKSTPETTRRHRNSSSSSEPELRPVVKKLDQISGFENIIRDSKMGIKLPKVPDIIQPICDRNSQPAEASSIWKDLKPPEIIKPFSTTDNPISQPIVNGIETDPTLISTLLKENPAPASHLPVIESKLEEKPVIKQEIVTQDVLEKRKGDHHHKSEKKKKKDKHKHKEKDKSKEEKKKHKHKDKDREKHKKVEIPPEEITPLKITIPKEKIQAAPQLSSGLKVKISKDRLQPENTEKPPSLKIKISKDAIQYNSVNSDSKKRDRDNSTSPNVGPPTKILKTSYKSQDTTHNGRNSYSNKVAITGEGEASQHRLTESKYHSKSTSKML